VTGVRDSDVTIRLFRGEALVLLEWRRRSIPWSGMVRRRPVLASPCREHFRVGKVTLTSGLSLVSKAVVCLTI
jgi:hypothetical protein